MKHGKINRKCYPSKKQLFCPEDGDGISLRNVG
jgi:hypothetical protein